MEKSSEWKLPPNIYRHLGEGLERPQAGKKGPYQCFTVERDDRTIKNHHAPKSEEYCKVDFYDTLKSINNINTISSCSNKNKFLKGKRFDEMNNDGTPPPTKYFPQNFSIKPKSANVTKSKIIEVDPVFYYPQTTVPEREMTFNKEPFSRPESCRYNPHDVTCRCHLKATTEPAKGKRCPGKIDGEGHTHVFQSTVFRLVHPTKINTFVGISKRSRRKSHFGRSKDDLSLQTKSMGKTQREPISFRVRSSIDVQHHDIDDMDGDGNRSPEIRYNTMVKKRSLFSLKTGRPVAFLTASPRFDETTEKPIKVYEKVKQTLILPSWSSTEIDEGDAKKPGAKRVSKQRLEELAKPKNALPKRTRERIQVFTKLPPPTATVTAATASVAVIDENLDIDNIKCEISDVDVVKLRVVNEEREDVEENIANVISKE